MNVLINYYYMMYSYTTPFLKIKKPGQLKFCSFNTHLLRLHDLVLRTSSVDRLYQV